MADLFLFDLNLEEYKTIMSYSKFYQQSVADPAGFWGEEAKRIESTVARDDAKRALATLDTIIGGIDAATLAQAKTAIKQLAQIQKHIIIATVGRE